MCFLYILGRYSELSLKIKQTDTINVNIIYFYIWILYLFLIVMKTMNFVFSIFNDNLLEHNHLLTFSNYASLRRGMSKNSGVTMRIRVWVQWKR